MDHGHTVDGKNPANQLRLVVYPIIYRVLYIPGGAGFLPSTVFYQEFLSVSKKRTGSFRIDVIFLGDLLPMSLKLTRVFFRENRLELAPKEGNHHLPTTSIFLRDYV